MELRDLQNGQKVRARHGRYLELKDQPDWGEWYEAVLYVQRAPTEKLDAVWDNITLIGAAGFGAEYGRGSFDLVNKVFEVGGYSMEIEGLTATPLSVAAPRGLQYECSTCKVVVSKKDRAKHMLEQHFSMSTQFVSERFLTGAYKPVTAPKIPVDPRSETEQAFKNFFNDLVASQTRDLQAACPNEPHPKLRALVRDDALYAIRTYISSAQNDRFEMQKLEDESTP